MFVGEVAGPVTGARDAGMLSAGRPVSGTVIASRLCHVSAAQRCRRERGTTLGRPCFAPGARPGPAIGAALPTMSWRRAGEAGVDGGVVRGCRAWSSSVRRVAVEWCRVSLDAGGGDAFDELALEGEEEQEDRHDHDGRPGEAGGRSSWRSGPWSTGRGRPAGCTSPRSAPRRGARGVVPAGGKVRMPRSRARAAQRQDDAGEDPQLAPARRPVPRRGGPEAAR